MSIIKKLKQIKEGWTNYLNDDEAALQLAEFRAPICAACPKNVRSFCSKAKGGCGCFIPAKICCTDCKCPDKKW